jgi:hypothetical protein
VVASKAMGEALYFLEMSAEEQTMVEYTIETIKLRHLP